MYRHIHTHTHTHTPHSHTISPSPARSLTHSLTHIPSYPHTRTHTRPHIHTPPIHTHTHMYIYTGIYQYICAHTWWPWNALMGCDSPSSHTYIMRSVEHVANDVLLRQSTSSVGATHTHTHTKVCIYIHIYIYIYIHVYIRHTAACEGVHKMRTRQSGSQRT